MIRCHRYVITAFAVAVSLPATVFGQVFLSQSTMLTSASDGASSSTRNDNALLPWMYTREVFKAPSSAATTYDFSTAGGDVTFHLDLDHVRGGAAGNAARSYGFFTVTPLEDMAYSISGDYASAGGGATTMQLSLTIGVTELFKSFHRSSSLDDHAFVAGLPGGNVESIVSGSTHGILSAYQNYLFSYRCEIEQDAGAMAATGAGDLYFNLTAVPEPATAWMVCIMALACRRNRKR